MRKNALKHAFKLLSLICHIRILTANVRHGRIDLPKPAIYKPVKLWTGKQLFSLILKPYKQSQVKLNLRTKGKNYNINEDICANDAFIVIHNSEIMCGVLDKDVLGSGYKNNVFYLLLRDFGEKFAADAMLRLARMTSFFLMNRGFSIGIGDVTPSERLLKAKKNLLSSGYNKCNEFIQQLKEKRLQCQTGCDPSQTLEVKFKIY